MPVIAVIGEALIDLVAGGDGRADARPGGGPYNTARTLARLGAPVTFLGGIAGDGFGRVLRDRLAADGVVIGLSEPSAAPSTLAVAQIDQEGAASYRFYLAGTAAAEVSYPALRAALPDDVAAVHVGSLGLAAEPVGSAVERLVLTDVPRGALVMLDPNCRPGAVPGQAEYRRRVDAVARRADVVRASVADLACLYPDKSPAAAATAMLGLGVAVVLVTEGPHPARAFLPGTVLAAAVPRVAVVDTIGAGDAFGGGFLAWWMARGLTRADLRWPAMVSDALRTAAAVAALTCTRPGADPPALAEVRSGDWWPEPVV
jgi:fructokinase